MGQSKEQVLEEFKALHSEMKEVGDRLHRLVLDMAELEAVSTDEILEISNSYRTMINAHREKLYHSEILVKLHQMD